jgi:hypothetical protein
MELIAPTALIEPDSSFILLLQLLNRLFTQFLEKIGALCQYGANPAPSETSTSQVTAPPGGTLERNKAADLRRGGADII